VNPRKPQGNSGVTPGVLKTCRKNEKAKGFSPFLGVLRQLRYEFMRYDHD